MRDEQFMFLVGDILHGQADRRDRHIEDQIDLLGVVPAPGNAGADVRLQLMVGRDQLDRLAERGAAEIVDRHLRGGD